MTTTWARYFHCRWTRSSRPHWPPPSTTACAPHGCDNTLRAAQSWTDQAGLDWTAVQAGLEGRGGFCDCEVLLNAGLATS